MRVLLFSSQLFTIANYALCIPRSGIDVFMAPLFSSRQKKFYKDDRYQTLLRELQLRGVRIVPIFLQAPDASFRHFLNPLILIRDFKTVFQTLKALTPDAVIGSYILHAIPLAVFKKIFHYKLFVRASGGDINLHGTQFHRIVRKFIYSQSDLVFAVSRELSEKIYDESGCKPILLTGGTDPSFFRNLRSKGGLRQKWHLKDDEIVILTVCNLVKHKGVNVLVKAVSLLRNRIERANVQLVIVGKGPEERSLKQLASNLGLEERVVFLGYRSRKELLELYNAADLFVLASYTEGLPAVLLEAMACENLCISTPVGDVGKVIKEGRNGFLVKTGESVMLAEKMKEILLLPEEQKFIICKQARKTIETHFDLRRTADKMIRFVAAQMRAR